MVAVCCRSIALPQPMLVAAGDATIHHGGGQCARDTRSHSSSFSRLHARARETETENLLEREDKGMDTTRGEGCRGRGGGGSGGLQVAQRRGGAQGVRSKKLHALLYGAKKKKKKTLDRLGVGA